MNAMEIINIPIINALVQILLATLVMIIVNPTIKNKLKMIVIIAVLTEIVMDGADFIYKGLTHNFFFAVYFPLSLFFVGYVYRAKKLQIYSLLLMISFLTYLTMDAAIEGDLLTVWYPVTAQYYIWNTHSSVLFLSGPALGAFIVLSLSLIFNAVEKKISGVQRIIQIPVHLPSHSGILFSRRSYRSPSSSLHP